VAVLVHLHDHAHADGLAVEHLGRVEEHAAREGDARKTRNPHAIQTRKQPQL
jgi:hypothetical protein